VKAERVTSFVSNGETDQMAALKAER